MGRHGKHEPLFNCLVLIITLGTSCLLGKKGTEMVAPRRIRQVFCTVVCIPTADERIMDSNSRFNNRPSEMLPWADPTIAKLVSRLQSEVRNERRHANNNLSDADKLRADLEPPTPATEVEIDWPNDSRWTVWD